MSIRFVDYPEEEIKHGWYAVGACIRFISVRVQDSVTQRITVRAV